MRLKIHVQVTLNLRYDRIAFAPPFADFVKGQTDGQAKEDGHKEQVQLPNFRHDMTGMFFVKKIAGLVRVMHVQASQISQQ